MEDDFAGRFLTRRDALRWLGGSAAWFVAGDVLASRSMAAPSGPLCVFRPEQTEGPYFVDERLHRSDIRSDPTTGEVKSGVPLSLTIALSRIEKEGCRPLPAAQVDIWHCDALGVYSDVKDPAFNTIGRKFLRGYQFSDAGGEAKFLTIYPGWYAGRTVHIHIKVRGAAGAKGTFEFTSQMYFDDSLSDRIYADLPYATKGKRTARNHDDRIFRHGGERLMLAPAKSGDGYAATFTVGLQLPPD
ncbi:MAG TPA: intradiol ring-cleavage dioxygenase [Nitrospira sp.]|nr:intradiol ring-cleavage dioxygenase [Nitrospira sp.]